MARVRNIKPDFFRHGEIFDAEIKSGLPLRLAWIGLWCQADVAGRFRWKPRELKLEILPYDDVDFSKVLSALAEGGFVSPYSVDGKDYGVIPNFAKHQKFSSGERDDGPKYPDPPNDGGSRSSKKKRKSDEGQTQVRPKDESSRTLGPLISDNGQLTTDNGQSMSVSADANPTTSTPNPDDLSQIADWCVRAWTRCKEAKSLGHWPDARIPRNPENLSARRKESASLEEFRVAFIDRLQRMSAAYSAPIGENKWCPSLPWLLEPSGWEKAANKPTPQQIANAPRQGKSNERFNRDDPLLGHRYGNTDGDGGLPGIFARGVSGDVQGIESGDGGSMGRCPLEVPGRTLAEGSAANGGDGRLPHDGGDDEDP